MAKSRTIINPTREQLLTHRELICKDIEKENLVLKTKVTNLELKLTNIFSFLEHIRWRWRTNNADELIKEIFKGIKQWQ